MQGSPSITRKSRSDLPHDHVTNHPIEHPNTKNGTLQHCFTYKRPHSYKFNQHPYVPKFLKRYKNKKPVVIGQCNLFNDIINEFIEKIEHHDDSEQKSTFGNTGNNDNEHRLNNLQALISLDNTHFLDDQRYCEKATITKTDLLRIFNNGNNEKSERFSTEPVSNQLQGNLHVENQESKKYYFRTTAQMIKIDFSNHYRRLINYLFGDPNASSTVLEKNQDNDKLGYETPSIKPYLVQLWLSTSGCVTPLHYDKCHGLLIQVYGRKRFIVFDREEARDLYLHNGVNGPTHASKLRSLYKVYPKKCEDIDLNNEKDTIDIPDLHKHHQEIHEKCVSIQRDCDEFEYREWVLNTFPNLRSKVPYIVDLYPGDILYTPPGWMHEVISLDNSFSITVPWDMSSSEKQDLPSFMMF